MTEEEARALIELHESLDHQITLTPNRTPTA